MGLTAEGLYPVQIKKVKELLRQGRNNEKLYNKKKYNEIKEIINYGPFMTDVIEWEIHAYPLGNDLKLFLHLPYDSDNNGIKKYGYVNLLDKPETQTLLGVKDQHWSIRNNTLLGHEREFKPDQVANNLGRKMFPLGSFKLNRGRKDDTINTKLAVWFDLDSSWELGRKVCPPDLVKNLNKREFSDIYFVVEGEKFYAHRAVLAARSSVFHSKLDAIQRINRRNSNRITIDNMKKLTFKYLLHFIYNDSLLHPDFEKENTQQLFLELFTAAKNFKIERLKEICKKNLSREVINTIQGILGGKDWHALRVE